MENNTDVKQNTETYSNMSWAYPLLVFVTISIATFLFLFEKYSEDIILLISLSISIGIVAFLLSGFFVKYRKKLLILGVGLMVNEIIVFCFDFILYPFVIWKFGVLRGGVTMTVASFCICYATLLFYDWSKKDWIGIESIKDLKDYQGKGKVRRFFSWITKKGDIFAFLFLSIQTDPFIVVAYMRQGANQYNGMKKRDWTIFISSLVIGNLYWTIIAYTGVSIIEFLWKFFVR
jgi:hypothetical protein